MPFRDRIDCAAPSGEPKPPGNAHGGLRPGVEADVPTGEGGFVLVTAMWLLLLGAALVSLMMLRSAGRSETNRQAGELIQAKFDAQAAVDTIAADLLIRGSQSAWARLPAHGIIRIGGRDVTVDASSEEGRLDLNDGDPAVIDRALQGSGIAPQKRALFLQTLASLRAGGRRMTSIAEAYPLLQMVEDAGSDSCVDSWFTLYSGLSQPSEDRMSNDMAQALATPAGGAFEPAPVRPGETIRLLIHTSNGYKPLVVARVIGVRASDYEILQWSDNHYCRARS